MPRMRGPAPSAFPQKDSPRAPLKRKLDTNAQAPITTSKPKRVQRSSSYISISSSDEDEAPKANHGKAEAGAEAASKTIASGAIADATTEVIAAGAIADAAADLKGGPGAKATAPPTAEPTAEAPAAAATAGPTAISTGAEPTADPTAGSTADPTAYATAKGTAKDTADPTTDPTTDSTAATAYAQQQDLLDLIMSGRNVFFTGSAGCGKSTVLKAAVKKLRAQGKVVHITAPTGRAALGVNGVTTWSYMGWITDAMKLPVSKLKSDAQFRPTVKKRMEETDVLIIDEISMVENHHFQRMNECLKSARCWSFQHNDYSPNAPAFGGIQLLVTGDFCQLPPVKPFENCMYCGSRTIADAKRNLTEWNCNSSRPCGPFYVEDQWAFRSDAWEEANFTHVHLKEIHRQSDQSFVRMLQKCRLGIPFSKAEEKMLLRQNPDDPKFQNVTKLFAYKRSVQEENRNCFASLPGRSTVYKAIDGFDWRPQHTELAHYNQPTNDRYSDFPPVDMTLEQCKDSPLDTYVEMKVNALVMLKINLDTEKGLVNGSQGIVVGWEPYHPDKLSNSKKASTSNIDVLTGTHSDWRARKIRKYAEKRHIRQWPIVRFNNGITRTIYPWCMVNTLGATEPYSVLYRTQLPLVLAWAVSIHKSQGMTLTHAMTDLSQAWEQALKYVALSRVTSLDGLAILKPGGYNRRKSRKESLEVIETSSYVVREFLEDKFGRNLFTELEGHR
ncbi:atp-dependent dna helicase pif1 [Fusarium napiforme]|uniref:ATP-dependent DNA helicase n=1 Tax=Fusarium napiforme TaxID=42672 RepID=A0A8H5NBV3_9HYPO|nr:atp-dependent dna helicase pif1 [Fusarium napiforme]